MLSLADITGLLAGAFVIAAFHATEARRLRRLALVSNVLFALYAWQLDLAPILFLHAILFVLNVRRLRDFVPDGPRALTPYDRELLACDLRISLDGLRYTRHI